MFVESGCVKNLRCHKCIYFERFSFCLSTDINFTSFALSPCKIYSFEKGIVKDTDRNPCHFNHTASRELDAVKFHSLW